MTFEELCRLVQIDGKTSTGYRARCPAHDDNNASLMISDGEKKIVVECRAGCDYESILRALSLEKKDLYPNVKKEKSGYKPAAPPVGPLLKFPIKTIDGYTVAVRTKQRLADGSKDLRWEQPDGRSGLAGAKVADLPLYGSEHIKDWLFGDWIELCEGEGAADALRELGGHALGTSTGASSCPSPGVLNSLLGRKVRLWPDNDKPGLSHMAKIREALNSLKIKNVTLDTSLLPPKGDAVEWIEACLKHGTPRLRLNVLLTGETRQELPLLPVLVEGEPTAREKEEREKNPEKFAKTQEEKKEKAEKKEKKEEAQKPKNQTLPVVVVTFQQMSELIDQSWNAIIKANNPPALFRRGQKIVTVNTGETTDHIEEIGEVKFRGVMARNANWFRETSGDDSKLIACFPPREVAQDSLVNIDRRLPVLESVSNAPVFAPDGSLCIDAGYSEKGKIWLTKSAEVGLQLAEPTKANALAAVYFLLNDFLVDFRFAKPCDKAHALAALLLPAVRPMIKGPTPLHDISSPVQRSGKSLLASAISTVYMGSPVVGQRLPMEEEEIAKTLLSILTTAPAVVFLDNGDNKGRVTIDSGSLEAVVTNYEWTGRRLGSISMVEPMPVRPLWFITGVNLQFGRGLVYRRVRIRIDPKMEDPSKRTGFVHPGIIQWTQDNRAIILSAIFTAVRYFLSIPVKERKPVKPLGGYEDWYTIIGGILNACEVPGFLEHFDDPEEQATESGSDEWEEFIEAWWKEFQDYQQPTAKLNDFADKTGLLDELRGDKSKHSQTKRLGAGLKKIRGRIFSGKQVVYVPNTHTKGADYKLEKISESTQKSPQNDPQTPVLEASAAPESHVKEENSARNIPVFDF